MVRCFLGESLGKLEVQGKSLVPAGMELAQADDFSIALTPDDFTKNFEFLPTSPKLWAGR